MRIFRNGFSSMCDVKNYIFARSFSAILKYEPRFSRISSSTCATFTSILSHVGPPVVVITADVFSSNFQLNKFWHAALSLYHQYTLLSVGIECQWGKSFTLKDQSHCELPCGTHSTLLLLCTPMYSLKGICFAHCLSSVPSFSFYP